MKFPGSSSKSVVLKRLDDCDKTVRELSISTIKSCFKVLFSREKPKESISDAVLEFIYSSLVTHLDDQDKSIQTLVLDCLTLLADLNTNLLRKKLQKETFRDKQIQEELMNILNDKIENDGVSKLEKEIDNISVVDN